MLPVLEQELFLIALNLPILPYQQALLTFIVMIGIGVILLIIVPVLSALHFKERLLRTILVYTHSVIPVLFPTDISATCVTNTLQVA